MLSPRFSRQELPLRRSPLSGLAARHEHRARRRDQRERGHVWAEFSSETYKKQPAIGSISGLYNPQEPDKPLEWELKGGGRGYYRTPTLVSMWATAPYLHNNALGMYVKDPSVRGRMLAFYDAAEKLLWPERRLGVQSIIVTSIDTELQDPGPRQADRIPAGTPVDLIARVDPREVPRSCATASS